MKQVRYQLSFFSLSLQFNDAAAFRLLPWYKNNYFMLARSDQRNDHWPIYPRQVTTHLHVLERGHITLFIYKFIYTSRF